MGVRADETITEPGIYGLLSDVRENAEVYGGRADDEKSAAITRIPSIRVIAALAAYSERDRR
jgi:hypothetical protein